MGFNEDLQSTPSRCGKSMPARRMLNRKSPNDITNGRRRSQIKLTDYGVTFEKYKAELERGITYGYRPHFGYPELKFNNVMEGLNALNCDDASGVADPMMQIVNSDSIQKFQNLLLTSKHAKMEGTTMVIEAPAKSLYNNCWLFSFIQ